MKKGYYIHFQGRESIGVSKKIDMQLKEFARHYDMEELEIRAVDRTLPQRMLGLFPMASITRNYEEALNRLLAPDFIYVRRTVADRAYVDFWKKVRERYPACRIIIEIFTYPYDKDDFAKWNAWPFYIKELLYRGRLKRYVDRFVTYTDDREIFGIPTLRTFNGIQVEDVRTVGGTYRDDTITLIGVAYMQRHHGYERIIEGMREYYRSGGQRYTLRLRLVGDGPEKAGYQEMVSRYQLQEYVTFYPNKSGRELDELYDDSDIALGSFGMYKLGLDTLGALKTREYLAKGMPFITGCPVDVLDADYPYVENFPNNAQSVDMRKVTAFYERLKKENGDKKALAAKIRESARGRISMQSVMQPIIDFIDG